MRHLLDALNAQERRRIDNMIDKHAHEMLQLIDKKVNLIMEFTVIYRCFQYCGFSTPHRSITQ